jgi:hypothetical protein
MNDGRCGGREASRRTHAPGPRSSAVVAARGDRGTSHSVAWLRQCAVAGAAERACFYDQDHLLGRRLPRTAPPPPARSRCRTPAWHRKDADSGHCEGGSESDDGVELRLFELLGDHDDREVVGIGARTQLRQLRQSVRYSGNISADAACDDRFGTSCIEQTIGPDHEHTVERSTMEGRCSEAPGPEPSAVLALRESIDSSIHNPRLAVSGAHANESVRPHDADDGGRLARRWVLGELQIDRAE